MRTLTVCIVTSNLCILYFKYNREQVFCILDLRVEVFDKSISNTFLKSIFVFCILNTSKSIFYNSALLTVNSTVDGPARP